MLLFQTWMKLMVVRRFYSLRIPVFGTVAMALMCIVLFMVPFALRGARMGIQDMQNNVADWLPKEYAETQDLQEFRKYFYGDQFVVASGPWCHEGDPKFAKFKEAIRRESLEYEADLKAAGLYEELRARRKGDELGLLFTGTYHENWGENNEKWLQGRHGKWYFINRRGELYRWEGQNNVVEGVKRFFERTSNGTNRAQGTYVGTYGSQTDDGSDNPFYQDPSKLCCRPFKSVISGPDALRQMAGAEGTMQSSQEVNLSAFEAEMEAHKVLSGALFGPTPPTSFNWTFESLLQSVDQRLQAKLASDENYRSVFDLFVQEETKRAYGGDLERLVSANQATRLETWYRLWHQLELPAPPRPTCLIVTLNEPVIEELSRAIGRPLMGKPRGRLPEIGISICGIEAQNLHMGGPPCDNVAIDEEGTNTLIRLAGLSFAIGLSLAYLSFRRISVSLMIFFVGGVSAISSLAIVWFGGSSMDAILMTMPSLVYVLGLSGAVHFVNYYRDACHEFGSRKASEIAIKQSWFPVFLSAFTTSLGLISLCTSTLNPIFKFGLFSAIAVMATIVLMYMYLPSALTIWKPGYHRIAQSARDSHDHGLLSRLASRMGLWIIDHYKLVGLSLVGMMLLLSVGLTEIKTTVQLLKLFDADAKILKDYRWLEENLGELVPAEIVVCVDRDTQKEAYSKQVRTEQIEAQKKIAPAGTPDNQFDDLQIQYDPHQLDLRYSMLERLELSSRVRRQLEKFFGADGLGVVGSGMSTDVFTPLYKLKTKTDPIMRFNFSSALDAKKKEMVDQDYLAVVGEGTDSQESISPPNLGREMWRISIRLAALNNVDYGRFVNDLKQVVEPILSAYEYRTTILKSLHTQVNQRSVSEKNKPIRILLLGPDPQVRSATVVKPHDPEAKPTHFVDQSYIFTETLQDLLLNRQFAKNRMSKPKNFYWIDPQKSGPDVPELSAEEQEKRNAFFADEKFGEFISNFDCVVLIEDNPLFKTELLSSHSRALVDARKHKFEINPRTYLPVAGAATMRERNKAGESVGISAIYTGIVPIVYKAQRALLQSLVESIALSFVMISIVMMIMLRPWNSPPRLNNLLNFRGGLLAMIPNVFPILVVFGYMGWAGIEVDIGSMMTASVAMGIAVDDTIHFMTWYSQGLSLGLDRKAAIRYSYDRVAIAMIQTTLIGGLGLAAFALSTFTPTQRFGVLMLFLLSTALIGDLLILPAILASPLGKYFGTPAKVSESTGTEPEPALDGSVITLRVVGDDSNAIEAPPPIGKRKSGS